jgi:sugar phosphate isomerase/epimerase
MNRRDFLKLAATATVTAAATASASPLKATPALAQVPLGVQLYTVRDLPAADLAKTLAAIRAIGYTEVETYWDVYTHPAKELRAMITDAGLSVPSGHFNYDGLEAKIDYAHDLGVQYMVCPMLPPPMWGALETFQAAAAQLNAWGAKVKSAGMQLGFHNHNYEFRTFTASTGPTTGFAALLEHTDPKLVVLEMDCYWITQAGRDPLKMLDRYASRIKMLHLKDRLPGFPTSQSLTDAPNDSSSHFAEVGAGTINFRSILARAAQNGVEHYFVERDFGPTPPLESLAISYKNLQHILAT